MMGISVSPIVPTVLARDPRTSYPVLSPTASSGLGSALQWLARNQSSDGSYGEFFLPILQPPPYAFCSNTITPPRAAPDTPGLPPQRANPQTWSGGANA